MLGTYNLPSSIDLEKDMSMQIPYQKYHVNPVNVSKINPVMIQTTPMQNKKCPCLWKKALAMSVYGSMQSLNPRSLRHSSKDLYCSMAGPIQIFGSQTEDADIGPILLLLEETRPDWSTISDKSIAFKTLWRN